MGRIERGEVNITLERLYELANALNISVYELLPNLLE
ncbi:helix-turn-helix domain-containing protein [Acinetobacter baumannii]|nr:helix-turn-helix transcriptional regulator [Acinetobacter baumannii]EJB8460209.1 helix-turn-helix transcriptional regulator [Acinetobacter baumannii]EJB8475407.1 helix-turn-helix transcriptional regulator [Acinetobacter baumannii]EJB8552132.1 helix-turn-helix transcriptional regulator [Acinetobacter baumannii]EJB8568158.1 helix-turn-helix transcriptional regulator [Acinetobacter baumannii]